MVDVEFADAGLALSVLCPAGAAILDQNCPHCGRFSHFPNVQAAELEEERHALALRYQAALDEARSRQCGRVARSFEKAAGATKAVIACSVVRVDQLASSPRQLYPTYYQLLDAGVKLPDDDRFEPL